MFLIYFSHRNNIINMLHGTEHPTSIKEMIKKIKTKKNS